MAGRHEEAGYGYRSAGWVDSLRGEEEGILVEQALRLAYLLHRVVGWIDDVDGDTPDLEREAARWERKTDA